jgi:hypothetical protein
MIKKNICRDLSHIPALYLSTEKSISIGYYQRSYLGNPIDYLSLCILPFYIVGQSMNFLPDNLLNYLKKAKESRDPILEYNNINALILEIEKLIPKSHFIIINNQLRNINPDELIEL